MFKFEKLDAWKVSLELYRKVAGATRRLRLRDQVFLADQIRRAALSISANLAEGTGRESIREAKHFYSISKGSVYEVVSVAHVLSASIRKYGHVFFTPFESPVCSLSTKS